MASRKIGAVTKAPVTLTGRIQPTDDHIVVEYLPAEGVTPGGLFIPLSAAVLDPTQRKWDHSYAARILAVGPGRRALRKGFPTDERILMAVKVGDLVAMRQQNFPYSKAEYFGGAEGTIYFALESDVDGLFGG